jgi:hypothetical protein
MNHQRFDTFTRTAAGFGNRRTVLHGLAGLGLGLGSARLPDIAVAKKKRKHKKGQAKSEAERVRLPGSW